MSVRAQLRDISLCSPVRLRNVKAPQGSHGREVEAQAQLQADEGDEGDLSHEGTVLRPVSSEGGTKVADEDEPDCPPEDVSRPPAALLEQQGAQHDRHHEG